jgi:hypothetical protein
VINIASSIPTTQVEEPPPPPPLQLRISPPILTNVRSSLSLSLSLSLTHTHTQHVSAAPFLDLELQNPTTQNNKKLLAATELQDPTTQNNKTAAATGPELHN